MSATEIICGVNAVLECLRAGKRRVHGVLIAQGKQHERAEIVAAEARRRGVAVRTISRKEIEQQSRIEKNQGIAAAVDAFSYDPLDMLMKRAAGDEGQGIILMLDDIIDPQNLGSLIRSAHVSGASGVILPRDRAASVGPAATKAAAGAVEYIPIAQVTNIVNTIDILKNKGFWVVGADGAASRNLYEYDFTGHPHVIVMGAEGKGIRRLVGRHCDQLLSIPMRGDLGSYNVAVAGAIFLAEAQRQRWSKTHAKVIPFLPERA